MADGLFRGRVCRLDLESGEVPCALVLAQERTRSADDLESGEVFFIDVEGVVSSEIFGGRLSVWREGERMGGE